MTFSLPFSVRKCLLFLAFSGECSNMVVFLCTLLSTYIGQCNFFVKMFLSVSYVLPSLQFCSLAYRSVMGKSQVKSYIHISNLSRKVFKSFSQVLHPYFFSYPKSFKSYLKFSRDVKIEFFG